MKKLLVVLLTLALCVTALTSCDAVNKVKDGFLNLIGKGPKEETPAVTYNAEAAADYIFNLYQSKSITAADFEVTAKVALFDDASAQTVSYDVTWSVDTDKVTITKKDDNTYIVNVDEESPEELAYVLTATVTAADGTKATKSFNLTVPEYVLWSHEEYMAAKEGDNVVVKGIVVAITSESMNNKYNHLFLADLEGKGGYYCYDLEKDPVADLGIEVGMIVEVAAPVTPYSGMQETKGGSARIIDSNKHEVAPVDLSAKLAAGESLANYVGMPVIFKNVEIKGQVLGGTSEYLNFELNGKTAYVRTYVSDFPISFGDVTREGDVFSSPSKAVIDEAHATHRGWRADATGILVLYNSNPYLIPMGTDCFTYYELIVKTDAQKAQEALDELDIPTSISKNTVIDLAATSTLYSEVTFAWASDNANFAIADNKVNVTLGAAAATLKLTATATCGEATATKDFVIEISASVVLSTTKPYIPSLFQAKLDGGKTLYLDGTFGERYLNTTDDATKAVAIYAEAAEGGYKFYILVDGAKNYLYLYKNDAGKDAVKYDAANANVFSYNETVNAWVTDYNNDQYYLGTYNTFNTVSCSKLSYINADNTGKDQFPLEYTPVVENVALNGTLFQAKLDGGKTLYLDGTFGERYLNTTDDITKAVAIYAEKAEDGYKFYILVNDVKNYIYLYKNDAGKSAVKFDAENANVFKFDGATNAWATVYDGGDYYLGTYNTFNTVSSSKTSYINATNTGVEQFPLNYIIANAATPETPETPENPENPENPETPDTPANPETPETPDLSTTKGIYDAASKLANDVTLEGTYTMTGVIASVDTVYSAEHGNVTVSIVVDGYTFKCYRLAGTGADVIAVGDTITVSGSIGAYYNAPQFVQGCTLVSYEKAPVVDEPVDGTKVTVVMSEYAAANSWADATKYLSVTMDENITVTVAGGSNTGKYYNNGSNWRIYQGENPTITIAAANGKTIKSVKFTYASQNTGVITMNGTNVANTAVVEVNAASVEFGVGNTGSATNGQARITAIEVIYA